MRAIVLLLVLLSWGASLVQVAACPMGGHSAGAHAMAGHDMGEHAHRHAPGHDHQDAPTRHAAECGVVMGCGVPALASADAGLPRLSLASEPVTVRATRVYASPDLAAEPPPPKLVPRV